MNGIKTSMREAFEAAQIPKDPATLPLLRRVVRRLKRKPDLVRFPRPVRKEKPDA